MEIWSGPKHGLERQDEPGHPQPGLPIPELFSGPHSGTFFCTKFAAFPGTSSNNVDPADPTLFVAFPGTASNFVDNFRAPSWGFQAKFGPDLIFKSGQKHQKWSEMGPESTVWPETWSRSMPGPFRSLWDGSNPFQGAVPGLVLEVQVRSTMSVTKTK